jgi:hypothetical protein
MMEQKIHSSVRFHSMILHCLIKSSHNFTLPYAFEITPNGVITASDLIKIRLVIFPLETCKQTKRQDQPFIRYLCTHGSKNEYKH